MLEVSMPMVTIRELREQANLSQMQLAIKAGVTIPVISRIENGHLVSRSSFLHVCRALGVDPDTVTGVQIRRSYRKASS